jgi:hypothetical protein
MMLATPNDVADANGVGSGKRGLKYNKKATQGAAFLLL